MTIKKILFLITLLVTPVFVSVYAPRPVYAQQELADACEVDKNLFEKIQAAFENIDIRRTVQNMMTTFLTDGMFNFSTNMSTGQVYKCMSFLNSSFDLGADLPPECNLDDDELIKCQSLVNSYTDDVDGTIQSGGVSGQSYGSLASYANGLNKVNQTPIPVNLAYYMERQTENIPFVGTAFAQFGGSQAATYSGPLLEITFSLWTIVRNLAYGVMALIMIVIGVMIMTRKRVNPQTMVTVQYAIPKVIIALVLITFSYPIGATLASLAWALRGSATTIVYNLGGFDDVATLALVAQGLVPTLIIFLVSIILTGGVGLVTLILSAGGFIAALIVYIAIQIKILITYLKIIITTVTAPLTFAWSAVPGNESKVSDWFKKVLVLMASMLGMKAVVAMTHLVATYAVLENLESALSAGTFGGAAAQFAIAAILMPFIIQFIYIFGYYQAWQLPKKLEGVFMNPKGGGGRR